MKTTQEQDRSVSQLQPDPVCRVSSLRAMSGERSMARRCCQSWRKWEISHLSTTPAAAAAVPMLASKCLKTNILRRRLRKLERQSGTQRRPKKWETKKCVLMEFAWWGAYPGTNGNSKRESPVSNDDSDGLSSLLDPA